jgi:hypothetical protein
VTGPARVGSRGHGPIAAQGNGGDAQAWPLWGRERRPGLGAHGIVDGGPCVVNPQNIFDQSRAGGGAASRLQI